MKKITVRVEFTVPDKVADAHDLLDRITKVTANELCIILQNHYATIEASGLTTVEIEKQ